MNIHEHNELVKEGRISQLRKQMNTLTVSIQTAATVIATALYTTGDIEQIDLATAQAEFVRLKNAMADYKKAKAELKALGGDFD